MGAGESRYDLMATPSLPRPRNIEDPSTVEVAELSNIETEALNIIISPNPTPPNVDTNAEGRRSANSGTTRSGSRGP